MQLLVLPRTVPTDVEVWLLTLNLQAPLHDSDLSILNDNERKYAFSLYFHEDRVRSVVTRAVLRKLLAARAMITPESVLLTVNEYGKPCLQGNMNIEFNVSHAGHFSLIALSNSQRIGVDIEYVDRQIDVNSLGKHVFSPLEHQPRWLTQLEFIRRWVAKESALKALGVGISEHLQSISILPGVGKEYQIVHDYPAWPLLKGWLIEVPADDYVAALTVEC